MNEPYFSVFCCLYFSCSLMYVIIPCQLIMYHFLFILFKCMQLSISILGSKQTLCTLRSVGKFGRNISYMMDGSSHTWYD